MNIISIYDIHYSLLIYLNNILLIYLEKMHISDIQHFLLSRSPTPEVSQEAKDWCALFIRYPQGCGDNLYDILIKQITSYKNIKHFLIAKEEDHFHLMLQCPDQDYQNWIKSVIKNVPFSLGGKNSGSDGHYGKVKLIKNLDKMLSYTLKDGCYVSTFGHTEWFKRQLEQSYKKSKINRQTFRQKLFAYLSDREYIDIRDCQIRIIDFYRQQDPMPALSRQAIKNHALNYFMTLRKEGGILFHYSSESIYEILNNY